MLPNRSTHHIYVIKAPFHLVLLSHRSSYFFLVQYISTYFQARSIPVTLPQKKRLMYPSMHLKGTEGEAFILCRKTNSIQITDYYEVFINL